MAVILVWENPETTFLPIARSMKVIRGANSTVVSEDAPWGFLEDTNAIDPNETYTVFILDGNGNEIGRVENQDIKRYIRPAISCKVTFEFKNPDGSPGYKKIEIRHPIETDFYQVICSNRSGKAEAIFLFNQRILITVVGHKYTLDCVVPEVQNATFEELVTNGSWVLTELRGTTP